MNLLFNEYIKFLKDNGIDVDKYGLREGYFWIDSPIIKAYDKQGNLHKIFRLDVDNKLNLSIKKEYGDMNFEIESWEETLERKKDRLKNLEDTALNLIDYSVSKYKGYTPKILSSGGKDSNVVTYLVRKIIPNTEILFNNTSMDCADTYLFMKNQQNVRIINPKEGFYQWRKRTNFVGNRISRACCSIYKEGAMLDVLNEDDKYLFFMGMRNEESSTRSNYLDEWKNKKWRKRDWMGILPIRTWTEEDVWLYTLWRNIPINTKYKKGYARVGCAIACPYYTKSVWVLDKYWYPTQYKRWHDILDKDFVLNNKDILMNCTQEEYHICWTGGVYRKEPTQEVIEQFAIRNGIDVSIAKNYFNHKCSICNARLKSKEVLGMNMKFYGRQTTKFYCKDHLKEQLNITEEEWENHVNSFKEQGCSLF